MNEKIGGVEGTKLDEDFVEMERVSIIFYFRFRFVQNTCVSLIYFIVFDKKFIKIHVT